MILSFDAVGDLLDELAEEFPEEFYRELNGGISLLPQAVEDPQGNVVRTRGPMPEAALNIAAASEAQALARMKRDGVIRLQLVAFGLIEAGRIEFTPDYVLLMDRINRQYIKVNYGDVAFLRESGLNFNSLQSLFWGELFVPGEAEPDARSLAGFNAYEAGTDMGLMLERSPLTYRWVADKGSGQVKTANVTYKDAARGNTQLTWHYGGFEQMGRHKFPTTNDITVATPKHTVRLSYSLGGIGHDSGWETPTEVTSRYRQVKLDDILRKLSSL